MGLGVAIVLTAVGAVLAFAVHGGSAVGVVHLHTLGLIVLSVGALGTVLALRFWSSWGGAGIGTRRHRCTVGLCTIEEY